MAFKYYLKKGSVTEDDSVTTIIKIKNTTFFHIQSTAYQKFRHTTNHGKQS